MKLHLFVPFVTYPQANADVFAGHAAAFAAGLDADLHAIAFNVSIPDVSNALSRLLLDTPEMIRRAEAMSRERGEHLLSLLKERAATAGIRATTAAIAAPVAGLGDAAATRARYFDLGLVGWEAGNDTARMTAEALIFGAGRPVILWPELAGVSAFDHIAVAWDGSRVAARALADARPLLERATRVSVITVLDEKPLKERDAGGQLANELRGRGLAAEAVSIQAEDCPIAETLQHAAVERGCRLLVMGGYGHSRFRDFVLGGATQGVLSDLLMPVLLSH